MHDSRLYACQLEVGHLNWIINNACILDIKCAHLHSRVSEMLSPWNKVIVTRVLGQHVAN